jgi:hypothetical protein
VPVVTNHSGPKDVVFASALNKLFDEFARDMGFPRPSWDFEFSFKDLKDRSDNPQEADKALKWLTASVRVMSDISGSGYRQMTLMALEALGYGETQRMLRAIRAGRKINWTLLQYQLMAIAFVKFRTAQGMKKYKAHQEVGKAFGVSGNTIRTWERRLQSEFGAEEFEKRLAKAQKDIDQSNPQEFLLDFAQRFKLEKKRTKGLRSK